MSLSDEIRLRNFERYWKKHGRKKLFNCVHRYLRLRKELLEDPLYKDLYDYTRNTLIAYFKRDHNEYDMSDEERGNFIDAFADVVIRDSPDRIKQYQWIVEKLYKFEKESPSSIKAIRI